MPADRDGYGLDGLGWLQFERLATLDPAPVVFIGLTGQLDRDTILSML